MILTNKAILTEMLFFYTTEEICGLLDISKPTFKSLLDDTASEKVRFKLEQAFKVHIQKNLVKSTIKDLREIVKNGKTIFVDTPDEPQLVTTFFDKKDRQIYKISTVNHSIKCSGDHLIESDLGWIFAKDILGQTVLTTSGFEPVTKVEKLNIEPVFDFEVQHQNHRYWGGTGISSHNSGKSFIISNVMVQAQKDGFHVLAMDSENALDVEYLKKIGVKTDEDNLTYVQVTTIEDVNSVCSEFFSNYKKTYGKDNEDSPKVLIVLDSLAMLSSKTEIENYDKAGEIKADQGILAKRRKAMLRLIVGNIAHLPIAFLLSDHTYPSDVMLGDGAWAITNSVKYSCSIIGIVTKLKLKDEGIVTGVRMRFETYKSRFAVLGTKIELEVPYSKGMSPYSGLIEILEEMKVIAKGTQPGEKTQYISEVNGERIKFKNVDDLTEEIVQKLFKHPNAVMVDERLEEEVSLTALDDPTLQD